MNPLQLAAAAAKLSVDLATVTDDRLIELCLLYRSAPDALETFPTALAAEIERRFTAEQIGKEDVMFSVLQNFANQFKSPVSFFAHKMQEMAATVNRDIWFTNNEQWFKEQIGNEENMQWLVGKPSILEKTLNNRYALAWIAQSTSASTAVLTNAAAVALWKNADNLWQIWPQHQAGMTVLAQSSELVNYVINDTVAMSAIIASSTAMSAVIASSTAMTVVAASSTAMSAVAASSTAMSAVAASSTAMNAVAASDAAMSAVAASSVALECILQQPDAPKTLIRNNQLFQTVRQQIYDTVKTKWAKKRGISLRQGSSGIFYLSGNSSLLTPAGFVFVCLGSWGTGYPNGRHQLEHPDGSIAATGGYREFPSSMIAVDGISFNGAKVKQVSDIGSSYAELWAPE